MTLRAKKHLGQHFLFDPRILGRIADSLQAHAGDPVLEIGPGRGTLTKELVARNFRVTAIERDAELIPGLLTSVPSAVIAAGDALALDWWPLLGQPAKWYVIGNIPYNLTSPLLERALVPPRPAQIVFLIQREVADRLGAKPDTDAYGALTVGIQVAARVERLFTVPAGAFRPPPRVESAVVRLTPLAEPLIRDAEVAGFRRFVVGLFGVRRKQLVRGIRTTTGLDQARIERALARTGTEPTARPETLAPDRFVGLFRAIVDERGGGGLAL